MYLFSATLTTKL